MKKISKIVLGLTVIVALTGCDTKPTNPTPPTEETETNMSGIFSSVRVYCDKEKGVEYIFFKSGYAGGATIRRNADGTVSTCK
jgi:uncharacterized lipoprotein YehR (DUF1307 family)